MGACQCTGFDFFALYFTVVREYDRAHSRPFPLELSGCFSRTLHPWIILPSLPAVHDTLLCMQFRVPWHTVLDNTLFVIRSRTSAALRIVPHRLECLRAVILLSRALNRLEELDRFAVPDDDFLITHCPKR